MDAVDWEEAEWELCNDDGFVYKRKQRRLDPPVSTPPSQLDPEAEERHRIQRRKRTLLKLKDRYQSEIKQWENLSKSLKEMEERSHLQQQKLEEERQGEGEQPSPSMPSTGSSLLENNGESVIEDLLSKVEAQEAAIEDFSYLCGLAEALCSSLEEQMKNSFIDLPVWASPRELMASLCDE